jgi:hypothetical protein
MKVGDATSAGGVTKAGVAAAVDGDPGGVDGATDAGGLANGSADACDVVPPEGAASAGTKTWAAAVASACGGRVAGARSLGGAGLTGSASPASVVHKVADVVARLPSSSASVPRK